METNGPGVVTTTISAQTAAQTQRGWQFWVSPQHLLLSSHIRTRILIRNSLHAGHYGVYGCRQYPRGP